MKIKISHSFVFALLIGFVGCNRVDYELGESKAPTCDLSKLTSTASESYLFDSNFKYNFSQSTRWESFGADITLVNGKGQLTAISDDVSSEMEAWKLYKQKMPYNKSWQISLQINIPLYWNANGGKRAQVGAGIFVGKPVESGQSLKVYECNMAAINGDKRFVQAQLVANRLGGDPIDVQLTLLALNKEMVNLKIEFCSKDKSLLLYIDNKKVGQAQKINSDGLDDWTLADTDGMDVGVMGFAENTVINSNQPTIDNFEYKIY